MFQESSIRKVGVAIGGMIIIALAAYTYYTIKQSQYMFGGPVTISVVGKGEVFATPDIATFSFSVVAKEDEAVTAQNKVSETSDTILAYLEENGVEEKDVKTEYYNLTPRYEYPETVCTQWGCPPRSGEPKLIGYEVMQNISVKIRDTSKAGEIISAVGSRGALNVSGLSFTIDDEEILVAEAREKAINDAQEKGRVLAKSLNAHIVRMTGYWEEQGGYPMQYGIGGGVNMMKAEDSSEMMVRPAALPSGENKISAQVNISYEIK
ncbi:MAG: SIMPL domain-containing protein [Candidatus Pacebacteria bacterium]|nr:SIMPL domain-containing protein [Candidatus Paceibacterota bacterium]MCF7856856.1 SIMPL domain-containing protein [Candidatus Paceibacterota bacterium]